jgi:bifunctional enzyme CysN/CysC
MTPDLELIESDVLQYLKEHENKELLRFITCGSVDDGKSTLIGRLLYDSKLLYEDQLALVQKESKFKNQDSDEMDLALVVDGLQAEREQGITIDVAYRFFSTKNRKFIIADTPGHEQYTRNMITGASGVDAAVILIDAVNGVLSQTLRHTKIASMMGIKQIVVAINKMDLVQYNERRFADIQKDFLKRAEFSGADVSFIPMSALKGDNVVKLSESMLWYKGSSFIEILEKLPIRLSVEKKAFRLPVQYVNRPDGSFRGYCGTVASGSISRGDEVVVLPHRASAQVESLYCGDSEVNTASSPMAVTVTLDREISVSSGDLLIHTGQKEPLVGDCFDMMLVWMDETPLKLNRMYDFKCAAAKTSAYIDQIYYKLDINSGKQVEAAELGLNEIGLCRVNLSRTLALDSYEEIPATGATILVDRISNSTSAAGMIQKMQKGKHVIWHKHKLPSEERIRLKGHSPAVFWLTGLSGSGKSTIANALEERLHAMGVHTYLLDGDNVRHGLNKNLGFSPEDRAENIRRVAEVAKLMVDAGLVVIVSFISPYVVDRDKARALFKENQFYEVFVDAPLEVCKQRDPKGLYKKAEAGLIPEFTGISAPYESPKKPEVHVRTAEKELTECVEKILAVAKVF